VPDTRLTVLDTRWLIEAYFRRFPGYNRGIIVPAVVASPPERS
jgi:hypothetical protein